VRWAAAAGAVPLLLLLAALWATPRWHPSDRRFPLQGIDVSHHQGQIAWPRLRAQGVDFAYIKASEGGDHRDRRLAENWRKAKKAGIPHGAYHFFTLCKPGAEQARNFIAAVPLDRDALPPAVDLEYMGNCSRGMSPAALHAELGAYLALVEGHYGRPALLYLTGEFDEAYGVSDRFDRPLWLRSLLREPSFGARPWKVWQVSSFRRVNGIEGRVDWNVVRGPLLEGLSAPAIPAKAARR
jgi:lysozyme